MSVRKRELETNHTEILAEDGDVQTEVLAGADPIQERLHALRVVEVHPQELGAEGRVRVRVRGVGTKAVEWV